MNESLKEGDSSRSSNILIKNSKVIGLFKGALITNEKEKTNIGISKGFIN